MSHHDQNFVDLYRLQERVLKLTMASLHMLLTLCQIFVFL